MDVYALVVEPCDFIGRKIAGSQATGELDIVPLIDRDDSTLG